MANIPEYLKSDCPDFPLCNGNCGQVVKQNEVTGRWYITMCHAGFNSKANNGNGYSSKARAWQAFEYYHTPEDRRRQMRDFARSARIED